MVFQILLRQTDFGYFCSVATSRTVLAIFVNICSGCYVLDKCDSYPRLSSDVDQAVRLFFLEVLVLVLLPMLLDYFNSFVVRVALALDSKLKL